MTLEYSGHDAEIYGLQPGFEIRWPDGTRERVPQWTAAVQKVLTERNKHRARVADRHREVDGI